MSILRPCLECGAPVARTFRGYCERHRRTEAQRGYGQTWRGVRAGGGMSRHVGDMMTGAP